MTKGISNQKYKDDKMTSVYELKKSVYKHLYSGTIDGQKCSSLCLEQCIGEKYISEIVQEKKAFRKFVEGDEKEFVSCQSTPSGVDCKIIYKFIDSNSKTPYLFL